MHHDIAELIHDNPDSSELFLVYADALQQRDDPLGELVTLHYALTQVTEHDRLVSLRNAYISVRRRHPDLLPEPLQEHLDLTLRFGMVHSAWIHKSMNECPLGSASAQLQALLQAPCARFIHSLRIDVANESQPDLYATLAAATTLDTLRHLEVHDNRNLVFRRGELLDPLWEAAPRLRHLHLRGHCARLHTAHHSELRRLTLSTHSLSNELLERLLDHQLPKLEELSLHLKPSDHPAQMEDAVREFIVQLRAPNLKRLCIHQTPYSNLLTRLLPESEFLSHLQELDLSNGSLTDEGAQPILENQQAYSHLARLDLRHNWLVNATDPLQRIGPQILVSDQHPWENLRLRR